MNAEQKAAALETLNAELEAATEERLRERLTNAIASVEALEVEETPAEAE